MEQIQHVGRLFRQAEHALMQQIQRHHDELGITSSQGYLLGYLIRRHLEGDVPIYAKDVEHAFGVRHSSVSGVLLRMEQKGFLQFAPDPADRRCKQIALTQKALDIHEQVEQQVRQTEEKIFSGMSDGEIETFVRLLKLAVENLSDEDDCPRPCEKEATS